MRLFSRSTMMLLTMLSAGCGSRPAAAPPAAADSAVATTMPPPGSATPSAAEPGESRSASQPNAVPPVELAATPQDAHRRVAVDRAVDSPSPPLRPSEPAVDQTRLATLGIRTLSGEHLTLYTDLPSSPAIDGLTVIFDQAFGPWCDYFEVPQLQGERWRVSACLIREKQKFIDAGLFPRDLPPFVHGYFRGNRIWLYDQQDDYYRRHLLLHEGTHAFMTALLGSHGPPWYSEGMAELLATHVLRDGRLQLNQFPADADDVPGWGRVRLVDEATAVGRMLKIDDILEYNARAHLELEPYGWCWAVAAFLDGHSRYRERFRKLPALVGDANFNNKVRALFADDWAELSEEWQVFASELEYGYDFARAAIDFRPGSPLPPGGTTVTIAADRGWQSTGITLAAGKSYRLQATGQFQVADQPRPWLSGPDGVTIRYRHGQPLGRLLAAVHPEPFDPRGRSSLLASEAVGSDGVIQPVAAGTLYLRINDSPAELANNAGTIEVRVTAE